MLPGAALYHTLDVLHRAQGRGLATLGWGPDEQPYRVVAADRRWRLRRYAAPGPGPVVLIVPAPIKRPYIWDLCPAVSVVRLLRDQGFAVHLLDWRPPDPRDAGDDLAAYADTALGAALDALEHDAGPTKPVVLGHSLGGTLAAIFAARRPDRLAGLGLLSTPLCLPAGVSRLRDALAALPAVPTAADEVVPGALLAQASALASPATFVTARWSDAAATALDPRAREVHARVARWILDEQALPAALVRDVLARLYREDRLCRGTLAIHGRRVGPGDVRVPVLAVANARDQVAPPAAMAPFLAATAGADARLLPYAGETGVVLQHLGVLVGREAFAGLWPEIADWIGARG